MTKKTTVAYLSGIVDGEGYIGIKKSKRADMVSPAYHARIQVRMVEPQAIELLRECLGGIVYKDKPSAANGRPLFCFQASDAAAERILVELRPYLRVKAQNADTVMEFRALQRESRSYRTKLVGYRERPHHLSGTTIRTPRYALSDDYLARCDALWAQCKELNRVGAIP